MRADISACTLVEADASAVIEAAKIDLRVIIKFVLYSWKTGQLYRARCGVMGLIMVSPSVGYLNAAVFPRDAMKSRMGVYWQDSIRLAA